MNDMMTQCVNNLYSSMRVPISHQRTATARYESRVLSLSGSSRVVMVVVMVRHANWVVRVGRGRSARRLRKLR